MHVVQLNEALNQMYNKIIFINKHDCNLVSINTHIYTFKIVVYLYVCVKPNARFKLGLNNRLSVDD